jgi:hypothetical protein
MELLSRPINSFTFEDIVEFCRQGYIEGYQLDYKKELPSKGLAKHFAAFSNSRGGVIIIGVEEDKTGKPAGDEGIAFDGKLVDKIHQYATSVDPRPLYDLHVTNVVKGKVFILVRIYEGDRTPYYVHNEANIYVRSGNITDPISLASPEAVELLVGKKDKARLARENYIRIAKENYEAGLKAEEKKRLKLIAEEKAKTQEGQPLQSQYYQKPLGSEVSMLTILLQPYYPQKALCTPRDIKANIEQIRYHKDGIDFPDLNQKPIQEGVFRFEHNYDGGLSCQQVFSTGLLYLAKDVLRQDASRRHIYIETIAVYYVMLLKALTNFYSQFNYQGAIYGYMELEGINGAQLKRIVPNGYRGGTFWHKDEEVPLKNNYLWQIELETSLLHNDLALQDHIIGFIKEIYWSLGYADVSDDLLRAFLKQYGWLVETPQSD